MPVLENRVAVVTGAASGIGLACARRYALEGATVVGLDLNASPDWGEIEALAPASQFHQLDVTDGDAQREAVAQAVAEFGRLDVLLTAAGVGAGGPVNMLGETAWDRVLEIHLKGPGLSIRSVLDTRMSQRSGSSIGQGGRGRPYSNSIGPAIA